MTTGLATTRVRRLLLVLPPIALAALTASSDALAYRPFDGTDADVADHGEFELELAPLGYLYDAKGPSLQLPTVVFNYGIAEGVELVVDARHQLALGTPHVIGGMSLDRDRITDTDFLAKLLLRKGTLQEHTGVSIATEVGPLLPELGGSHGFGVSDDVIVSMRWHDVTAHLNTQPMFDREHRAALLETLILEGPFRWRVRPVSELAVESEWYGPTTASALGGAIARVSDALDLDVAARALETDGHAGYEVRAGFTLGIPIFEPEAEKESPAGRTPEGEKP
jgi:hypothetical protein